MLDNSHLRSNTVEFAVIEVINRILSQPELSEHWINMENSEKNYFVGDIHNIIDRVRR